MRFSEMRVSRVEKILSPDSSRQKVKYLPTPPDFVAGAASLDFYRLLSTKIQHRNVET